LLLAEELHTVKSTGHIEFHAPFSGVRDDSGNAQAIKRVEVVISYYFLAAGHLKELRRYPKFTRLFTKGFEKGCLWIENRSERPGATRSTQAITDEDDDDDDEDDDEDDENQSPASNRTFTPKIQ
jgi:hypothetical protein